VPHLEQDRCAHRQGSRHRAPITAAGRKVVGVDLDVLRIPGAGLGQDTVLERDGALRDDEAIHGDVERPAGPARGPDQIRDVEALGEPDDAHGRTLECRLTDPKVPAQEGEGTDADVEEVEVGERGLAVRLPEAEPADDQPSGEWVERDRLDGHGAAGHRLDLRDQ